MCDRLLIVGPAPGRAAVGREPWIHTRSGRRLAAMLDVPVERLLEVVDGDNVLAAPPPDRGDFPVGYPTALLRGHRLLERWASTRILACGRPTAWALGCEHRDELLRWHACELRDASLRALAIFPHPSGASRWWNTQANRERAKAFLRVAVDLAAEVS